MPQGLAQDLRDQAHRAGPVPRRQRRNEVRVVDALLPCETPYLPVIDEPQPGRGRGRGTPPGGLSKPIHARWVTAPNGEMPKITLLTVGRKPALNGQKKNCTAPSAPTWGGKNLTAFFRSPCGFDKNVPETQNEMHGSTWFNVIVLETKNSVLKKIEQTCPF